MIILWFFCSQTFPVCLEKKQIFLYFPQKLKNVRFFLFISMVLRSSKTITVSLMIDLYILVKKQHLKDISKTRENLNVKH